MRSFIRTLVSKRKRRYVENGFNLDLTYITPRLIAMGRPAEGAEAMLRNPMSEVLRFLTTFHDNHFKVINLCAERLYDPMKLGGNVETIPVEDHNPAPLQIILHFCEIADAWLSANENNVLVTHCKAGKGRTGMMLCSYLLYSRYLPDPFAALVFFAEKRTHNGKGVTLPSQKRYVCYFSEFLRRGCQMNVPKLQLTYIGFSSNPRCKTVMGADVHIVVSCNGGGGTYKLECVLSTLEKGSVTMVNKEGRSICVGVRPTWLAGDVKIEFFERRLQKQVSLFYTWFNTVFVQSCEFALLLKTEMDKASVHLDSNFQVVFHFSQASQAGDDVSTMKDLTTKLSSLIKGVDCQLLKGSVKARDPTQVPEGSHCSPDHLLQL